MKYIQINAEITLEKIAVKWVRSNSLKRVLNPIYKEINSTLSNMRGFNWFTRRRTSLIYIFIKVREP